MDGTSPLTVGPRARGRVVTSHTPRRNHYIIIYTSTRARTHTRHIWVIMYIMPKVWAQRVSERVIASAHDQRRIFMYLESS